MKNIEVIDYTEFKHRGHIVSTHIEKNPRSSEIEVVVTLLSDDGVDVQFLVVTTLGMDNEVYTHKNSGEAYTAAMKKLDAYLDAMEGKQ